MAILSSVDIGEGITQVVVDHDPTAVATDVLKGSLIVERSTGIVFVKTDDGATTNVKKFHDDAGNIFAGKNETTLINVENLKVSLAETTDPSVSDDNTLGYAVGSRWVNVTLNKEFVAVDVSTGAAIWLETTSIAVTPTLAQVLAIGNSTGGTNIQFSGTDKILGSLSNAILEFSDTASAVNFLRLINAPTGSGPVLLPVGSDANIDLEIKGKGTGNILLQSSGGNIGVGTANPLEALYFVGIGRGVGAANNEGQAARWSLTTGSSGPVFKTISNTPIEFNTFGLARMTIKGTGQIGIGTTNPATSAVLELASTTGALLVTRMTTTQRDALTVVDGMQLYNSTLSKFQFRENGVWVTKEQIASEVPNTPAGNIAATDVQAAINELDSEKAIDAEVIKKDGSVSFTGDQAMGGNDLTGLPSIPGAADAATSKSYVDAIAEGLVVKQNVRVASQANINLASAPATIDGITMVSGDRVLIKAQTAATENGIYDYNGSGSAMTRSSDLDNAPGAEIFNGTFIPRVREGTDATNPFVITSVGTGTDDVHTIGVDNIDWGLFTVPASPSSLAQTLTAGNTTGGTDIRLSGTDKLSNSPTPLETLYVVGAGLGVGGAGNEAQAGRWFLGNNSSGPEFKSLSASSLRLGTNNLIRLTISSAGLISITSLAPKVVRTAVSNNTAAMGLAHKYAVTNTDSARTITISSADILNTDREFIIKDESGGAGQNNNVTIVTEGAELIDGVASIGITVDHGIVRLYSNGTNLFSW